MGTKSTGSKAKHTQHISEYKQESLKLAELIRVAEAAKQIGLHESQLLVWRKQAEYAQSVNEREANLATEYARLIRQLAQKDWSAKCLKKMVSLTI